MKEKTEILSLESLLIGYSSGNERKILLPPINAKAWEGELIAVVGQNGAGKSTLLRTLTGLQDALDGIIKINGKSIASYSRNELAQKIGYISTEPVKVSNMTVYDLASLGRFPHTDWFGKLTSTDTEIINDSVDKVGMTDFSLRYISELSDGERQRAMIARVLAQDTDILLLDEPTAFLDIRSKYEIIHLIHDLSRNRRKIIIYSTHDLNIALSESDKIWMIINEDFCEGAPEDLVLSGAFDHLFSDSLVKFNRNDGSFTFRNTARGTINITGEGLARIWTEKALNRAGYSITETNSELKVEINNGLNGLSWSLIGQPVKKDFNRIYDLVKWLSVKTV
jgi:iron complex transport system ATP-binding protein